MTIQEFIRDRFAKRLEKQASLVVYDPDTRYREIVHSLKSADCAVIDGSESTILGREKALDSWRELAAQSKKQKHLVVYVPLRKPSKDEEKQQDPYQIFAIGGGEFPRDDGDEYQALCHKASPELVGKIDELFKAGIPDFDTVNTLIEGRTHWPKLQTLLNAESAAEILTSFLSPDRDQKSSLEKDDTWLVEFNELLQSMLGLDLKTKSRKWAKIAEEVWRYILFSEFALDLPSELPTSLTNVPRAPETSKNLIYSVCENMRNSEKHQNKYMDMAGQVALELQLDERLKSLNAFGLRDTFSFQERTFLKAFVESVLGGHVDEAGELLRARQDSIWVKHTSERQALWATADRAHQLIITIHDLGEELATASKNLPGLVTFYCERMRQADRLHRDMERAVTETYGELESVGDIVEKARKEYLKLIEKAQASFIGFVEKEGWPVGGRGRNSEVFEKFVWPWVKERKKIAYFMIDALRYELGAELEKELAVDFKTELRAVCAQLPTITSVGMASLLPDAAGILRLVTEDNGVVPYLKNSKVVGPPDRLNYLRSQYGDRCDMVDLDSLLKKKSPPWADTVDLLIVRTTDIDIIGETKPLDTYRVFPDIIKKVKASVKKLHASGFERAVIATDHGFMLFSEREAGDTVKKPSGDWVTVKDRCLLGKGSPTPGTIVFAKADVGIRGDFANYAVPRTFATFVEGCLYSHGGLSFQECILPVISIDLSLGEETKPRKIDLRLSYKGGATDKITTRRPMIEIAVYQSGMFDEEVEFQLEAYDKKKVIGEVGTSSLVNPATNMVKIKPGEAIKVPLTMDDDFEGSFEVRATDPATGVNYATLKLRTDYIE